MENSLILYHYTSPVGFNEILRTRKAWASDCRFLNDTHELMHAINLLLERFEGARKQALQYAFHWRGSNRCHCIFSLSKSPKILSQWRGYADDGRGFAIGFEAKYLLDTQTQQSRSLHSCVYNDHESFIDTLLKSQHEDIEHLINMYENNPSAQIFWKNIDDNPESLDRIFTQLLRVKNPAFSEENEVRLIFNIPSKIISTRVSNGLIVPYYLFDLFKRDISNQDLWFTIPEIWLGPKCDKRNVNFLNSIFGGGWAFNDGIKVYECGYV